MIRRYYFLCVLFFSWSFDLEKTLLLAKQNDPGYKSQILALEAKLYDGKIAFAGFSPQVDLSIVGKQSIVDHSTVTNSHDVNIKIGMDIYNPEQIMHFKQGKLAMLETQTKLSKLATDHSLQTLYLYLNTLKSYSNLTVKQFALTQYQKSYQDALDKQKQGLLSSQQVLSYRSSLDSAILAVTIANNDLNHNVNSLERQTNTPMTHVNIYADDRIPDIDIPPLSETLHKALHCGNRIQLAHLSVQSAKQNIAASETAFLPKISVALSQSQPVNDFVTHLFDTKKASAQSAQISLSMNAFSGFSDLNTVRQKRMAYLSSEAFLEDEQYEIRLSIEKAYRDYENNLLQAKASLSAMKSAQASLSAILEKHQLGNISELEYINAITIATDAKENFHKSIYSLMENYLYIKSLCSSLDNQTVSTINQLLSTEIELPTAPDPSYPM